MAAEIWAPVPEVTTDSKTAARMPTEHFQEIRFRLRTFITSLFYQIRIRQGIHNPGKKKP